MTLALGTTLGPYQIQALLGAGGMGEVYRARDTRLGREVALKVLPEALSTDVQGLARFEREAKVLASLNHPNIATVHGFEVSGATHALVMELVEGPTLAERIARGAIPLDEALHIAIQIAEGLEFAHERGIVHRDLKPANIKLADGDAVKILDFGLAKAIEGDPVVMDVSNSPTISRMATQAGMILGTAAYMSPEQAKGKPVDRRTDIWAFGCVLFETLAGKVAFRGDSVTEILAAVLKSAPDWNTLPAHLPATIRHLVQRCLQKDVRQRLQAIGDARIALEEAIGGIGDDSAHPLPESRVDAPRVPPAFRSWVISGVLVSLAAIAGWWAGTRSPAPPPQSLTLAFIPPPVNTTFHDFGFSGGPVTVSPDGSRVAFSATDQNGVTRIYVRTLASGETQTIAGTEDGSMPFWSPDGGSLGFVSGQKLRTVNLANGSLQVLADSSEATCANSGAWSTDGTILFTPGGCTGPIARIYASGGAPSPVTKLMNGETGDTSPAFLPDNRHFLYTTADPIAIWMGSLSPGEGKLVLKGAGSPEYIDGNLLFVRDNRVFAQPFDPASAGLEGEAIPLAQALGYSASSSILAFQGGNREGRLQWFDRSGNSAGGVGPTAVYNSARISPDGQRILAEVSEPQSASSELWSYAAAGGPGMRLTFKEGLKEFGAWSPDGTKVAYSCRANGKLSICMKPADGSGSEKKIFDFTGGVASDQRGFPAVVDWSPDGRYLAFDQHITKTSLTELSVLPLFGDPKPVQPSPVAAAQFDGRFSPDGRWLAYFSYETGRPEIYVVPFPGPGGKFQISQNGGWNLHWDRRGQLYFLTMGDRLMQANLEFSGGALQVKAIQPLFQLNLPSFADPLFDVSPDGSRFLVVTSTDPVAARSIGLLIGWEAKLQGKHSNP